MILLSSVKRGAARGGCTRAATYARRTLGPEATAQWKRRPSRRDQVIWRSVSQHTSDAIAWVEREGVEFANIVAGSGKERRESDSVKQYGSSAVQVSRPSEQTKAQRLGSLAAATQVPLPHRALALFADDRARDAQRRVHVSRGELQHRGLDLCVCGGGERSSGVHTGGFSVRSGRLVVQSACW